MASVAEDDMNEATPEQMQCDEAEEEMHHLECNVAMLNIPPISAKKSIGAKRHLMNVPFSHRSILPFEDMVADISTFKKLINGESEATA